MQTSALTNALLALEQADRIGPLVPAVDYHPLLKSNGAQNEKATVFRGFLLCDHIAVVDECRRYFGETLHDLCIFDRLHIGDLMRCRLFKHVD